MTNCNREPIRFPRCKGRLVEAAFAGGELASAYVGTIRLKLLKGGAVVLRNTRRVRLLLSSSHPRQTLVHSAAARLKPG